MRPIVWLIRGLLSQPCPPSFEPFPVPADTVVVGQASASDVQKMHRAVEAYYRAATAALEADRQTAIKAWQVRQRRLQALLAVLEAAESEDSVAAALEELDATPCVPMPLGASLPTVFPPSPCLAEVYAMIEDERAVARGTDNLNRVLLQDVERIDIMLDRLARGEFAGLEGLDAREMRNADTMLASVEWMAAMMENASIRPPAAPPPIPPPPTVM